MADERSDRANVLSLDAEQWKTIIIVVPILGAIIATTYNVGYYHGIDINYFSMFSFSEHVVFAIEFMPFALIIVFGVLSMAMLDKSRSEREKGHKNRFFLIYGSALIVASAAGWYITRSLLYAVCGISFSVFLIAILIDTDKYLRMALTALIVIGMIFAMGFDMGSAYVKNVSVPTHILNDSIGGRLIRAGERGVLFATKEGIVLFRWNDIRTIRTLILSEADKEKIKAESRFY